jgi:hypothetical protein
MIEKKFSRRIFLEKLKTLSLFSFFGSFFWTSQVRAKLGFRALTMGGKKTAVVGRTFLAVGNSSSGGTTSSCAVSTTGTSWTTKTLPVTDKWAVSCSTTTTMCAVTATTAISVASTDGGASWTQGTTPNTTSALVDLEYGNSLFILLYASDSTGSNPTSNYATSPDGINWTQRTFPVSQFWGSVCWSGTQFCVVALKPTTFGTSTTALTSPDGITWTTRTLPSAQKWDKVAWNGSLFLATSWTTTGATSPDGITWTTVTLPASPYYGLTASNSKFIFFGSGGNSTVVYYSSNGSTWTSTSFASSQNWASGTWTGSDFAVVAASGSGTNNIAYSPDGITWSTSTAGVTLVWNWVG